MTLVKVLKGKIHGATVTDANVEYEGSITLDSVLMEAAGIAGYEAVCVWNMTQGTRLETYAIPGPPGSGTVCLNGAAAINNRKGDRVIVAAFAYVTPEEHRSLKPTITFVDADNRPVERKA
jgi:aspartate 1-decarboxylase